MTKSSALWNRRESWCLYLLENNHVGWKPPCMDQGCCFENTPNSTISQTHFPSISMRIVYLLTEDGAFGSLISVKLQQVAFTAHSMWKTPIPTYKHAYTKLNKMASKIPVILPSMEKNSLWHFTSGNGIKFMMCFSLITVQLLYMLFQLSQSVTIMWDFIFHLWKEERNTETTKGTEKIKTDFWLWWAIRFGDHILRRNTPLMFLNTGEFSHSTRGIWWNN